jgi:hypothetical protein
MVVSKQNAFWAAIGAIAATVPAVIGVASYRRETSDPCDGFYSTPAAGEFSLCHEGDGVATLQESLRTLGYYGGELTARFDVRTRQAVRAFQRSFPGELAEDGLAGPNTLRVLAREVGEKATVAATSSTA